MQFPAVHLLRAQYGGKFGEKIASVTACYASMILLYKVGRTMFANDRVAELSAYLFIFGH